VRGVDASQDAASITGVLHAPPRPFKVSECPPATINKFCFCLFVSLSLIFSLTLRLPLFCPQLQEFQPNLLFYSIYGTRRVFKPL
jgi:hypothetical protein